MDIDAWDAVEGYPPDDVLAPKPCKVTSYTQEGTSCIVVRCKAHGLLLEISEDDAVRMDYDALTYRMREVENRHREHHQGNYDLWLLAQEGDDVPEEEKVPWLVAGTGVVGRMQRMTKP